MIYNLYFVSHIIFIRRLKKNLMLYLRIKWCFEKNKIIVIRIFKINQIQIYFYLFLNQTKYKNSYVSKHLDCQTLHSHAFRYQR